MSTKRQPCNVVSIDQHYTICSEQNLDLSLLSANITGVEAIGTWTTSGAGSFDTNKYPEGKTYTPSESDIEKGEVVITLSADDSSSDCISQEESVTIEILDIRCGTFPWIDKK